LLNEIPPLLKKDTRTHHLLFQNQRNTLVIARSTAGCNYVNFLGELYIHLPSLSAHPVPCRAAGDPAITAIGRRQGVPAGGDKVLPRHWRSIVGAGRGAYENRHHRCQHGVQSHWTNHFGCYFLMRLAPSYLMSSLQFGRRLYIGPFQRLET
jgi:hypothetical protein